MVRTRLAECARCHVLAHQPVDGPYGCPSCGGSLTEGLIRVGFSDARRVFGEPGEPHREAPPPAKPPRAFRFVCQDGHKVRSKEEQQIDDWLTENGILHECEPKLKGMRPDWRVGSTYIEYWGLTGQQGYEARRAEKLALYRKRRLNLVELFPEDLAELETKLGFLRERCREGQQTLPDD